jgi:ferredoxin
MSIRIFLDLDKCQGHGLCVMCAPNAFDIDPDSGQAVLLPGAHLAASRASLLEAQKMCPVDAIAITEDDVPL